LGNGAHYELDDEDLQAMAEARALQKMLKSNMNHEVWNRAGTISPPASLGNTDICDEEIPPTALQQEKFANSKSEDISTNILTESIAPPTSPEGVKRELMREEDPFFGNNGVSASKDPMPKYTNIQSSAGEEHAHLVIEKETSPNTIPTIPFVPIGERVRSVSRSISPSDGRESGRKSNSLRSYSRSPENRQESTFRHEERSKRSQNLERMKDILDHSEPSSPRSSASSDTSTSPQARRELLEDRLSKLRDGIANTQLNIVSLKETVSKSHQIPSSPSPPLERDFPHNFDIPPDSTYNGATLTATIRGIMAEMQREGQMPTRASVQREAERRLSLEAGSLNHLNNTRIRVVMDMTLKAGRPVTKSPSSPDAATPSSHVLNELANAKAMRITALEAAMKHSTERMQQLRDSFGGWGNDVDAMPGGPATPRPGGGGEPSAAASRES